MLKWLELSSLFSICCAKLSDDESAEFPACIISSSSSYLSDKIFEELPDFNRIKNLNLLQQLNDAEIKANFIIKKSRENRQKIFKKLMLIVERDVCAFTEILKNEFCILDKQLEDEIKEFNSSLLQESEIIDNSSLYSIRMASNLVLEKVLRINLGVPDKVMKSHCDKNTLINYFSKNCNHLINEFYNYPPKSLIGISDTLVVSPNGTIEIIHEKRDSTGFDGTYNGSDNYEVIDNPKNLRKKNRNFSLAQGSFWSKHQIAKKIQVMNKIKENKLRNFDDFELSEGSKSHKSSNKMRSDGVNNNTKMSSDHLDLFLSTIKDLDDCNITEHSTNMNNLQDKKTKKRIKPHESLLKLLNPFRYFKLSDTNKV